MNSFEVASVLNIEYQEFQKIEPSIAQVLHLQADGSGRYQYSLDHLQALKEVFVNPSLDQNGLDFLFDDPKENSYSLRQSGGSSSKSDPITDSIKNQTEKPVAPRQKIPLNKKKERQVLHKELNSVNSQFELEPFDDEVKVRSALGAFERLSRDVDGTPIPVEEVEETLNPSQILADPRTRGLFHLIQEQKREFESQIQAIKSGDLHALKEENYYLKKQNRALQKEIETLENIIRNQNEDKQVLIRKLNEKFSLKSFFHWYSGDSKIFEGELIR